jgi:spore maturation protein CgeB
MKLRIALFYHSLVSDWNHGNAHFLRGICSELLAMGHKVDVYEPADGWSRANLLDQEGPQALSEFKSAYPRLHSTTYDVQSFKADTALGNADLALVHEWTDPRVIRSIVRFRRANQGLRIFFHDTHHRAVTDPNSLDWKSLAEFDALLVYGQSLRECYWKRGWSGNVFVWHEAADTRMFYPRARTARQRDLIWIGNWGDNERNRELKRYLVRPAAALQLSGTVHGVRFPDTAIKDCEKAGLAYQGWIPNHRAPQIFANHRVTVHVPRRPYVNALPGIPTIRPFEALACGIPLVCANWQDSEGLFRAGRDFLCARTESEMKERLREILEDRALAASLRKNGIETIQRRHTCKHRADELLSIYQSLRQPAAPDELEAVAG